MTAPRSKSSHAGYTLVETLVSIALFLSVALPLFSIVLNFSMRDDTETRQRALQIAQSTLTAIISEEGSVSSLTQTREGFLVERNVVSAGRLRRVKVSVFRADNISKPLIELSQSILLWE